MTGKLTEGAWLWAKHGLNPPDSVRLATQEYQKDSDRIGEFIEELCVTIDVAQVKSGALFSCYQAWVKDQGEHALAANTFGQRIRSRGFQSARKHSGRWWLGIGLKQQDHDA